MAPLCKEPPAHRPFPKFLCVKEMLSGAALSRDSFVYKEMPSAQFFSEAPLCKGSPAVWRTEGLSCPFTVKTRRYKQSAKGADLPQRVYLDVNDQGKTQARKCIAQ